MRELWKRVGWECWFFRVICILLSLFPMRQTIGGEQMAKEYADSLAEVQKEKGIVGSALMDSSEEISYNVWIDFTREDYYQRMGRWSE